MKHSKTLLFLIAFPLIALAQSGISPIRFKEIGEKAGARYAHKTRSFTGKAADVLEMFTSGGSSVAVGDYDNDGYEDIFLTVSETGHTSHLLHNNGDMTFTDVTEKAGVGKGNDPRFIVADALWFDYDNDGWVDLLVQRFGTPLLYHNEHNGTFTDVTAASGITKFSNTIGTIAFDYDNDGKLDLLFGAYFQAVNLTDLKSPRVLPDNLDNATNGAGVTLWKGDGKGHFVDVTDKAGLGGLTAWVLDCGHADLNNDGWQDIYLACDYGPDFMFFNNHDGTFTNVTAKAIGHDTKKGMNVDMADYDNDGWLDIYIANITDEYMKECNMLWHNNGDGTFTDVSKETGTCIGGWSWGAKFADFDNDGWVDIFVANGLRSASKDNYIPVLVNMITVPGIDFANIELWPSIGKMTWSGYQKKKLFRNLGTQVFKEMAAEAGVDNTFDGRGIGLGDFDNDGRLDFCQTNANQPSLLYQNVTEKPGNWTELKLIGTKSNRDAIGARATVKAGGLSQILEVNGGNGYASQSTTRLHFGVGMAEKIDSVEISWPSGLKEKVNVPINKIVKIQEGKGVVK